jgi:predicted thioredoxin/glutaredoxin
MSGIVAFGVRRLALELERILRGVQSMKLAVDSNDVGEKEILTILEEETNRNLDQLRKSTKQIIAAKVLSETTKSK